MIYNPFSLKVCISIETGVSCEEHGSFDPFIQVEISRVFVKNKLEEPGNRS